jgi:serine phosphatase RsbU (regulator of sigma subunit)/Tfp pilus assembly protein PilF
MLRTAKRKWQESMKTLLVLIFAFFSSLTNASAQEQSLVEFLKSSKRTEQEKLQKLNESLPTEFIYAHSDSAIRFIEYIERNVSLPEHSLIRAKLSLQKGFVYRKSGRGKKALEEYKDAQAIYAKRQAKRDLALTLNKTGSLWHELGNFSEAYECFQMGLRISEGIGDSATVSILSEELGILFTDLGDFEKAVWFFERGLRIEEKSGNQSGIVSIKNNLGAIYYNREDFHKALELFKDCITYYENTHQRPYLFLLYKNIGVCLEEMKNLDEALTAFERSEKMINYETRDDEKADLYLSMARVRIKKGEQLKARELLEKADILLDHSSPSRSLSILYSSIAEVYYKIGEYQKSSDYFQRFNTNEKTLQSEARLDDLKRRDLFISFQRKSIQDSLKQATDNRLKDILLKNQESEIRLKRNQQIYLIALILVILTFSFIIYQRLQITKKQKALIHLQKQRVELQRKEVLASIEYSKRIQTAILPSQTEVSKHLPDSFILYLPKDIVAGDFYWMEEAEGRTYFAACDCTGHGVPGAMVSVVCNTALNRAITEMGERLPGKILDRTREMVLENFSKSDDEVKDGMDASLACLLPDQKTLLWAGANNPLWIYRAGMRNIEEIKADKQPVGQSDQVKPFSTHEISVSPGDIIYLFTDGYADQFGGEHNRKLTRRGFKELLLSMADRAMDEQRSLLHEYLIQYRGTEEQIDDVCVMGVRV